MKHGRTFFLASYYMALSVLAFDKEMLSSSTRSLIIRGQDAVKHRYPYFVTLGHYGGGALIAPDIVLTAGHCKPRKNQRVRLRVGVQSLDDTNFEEFEIIKMIRHPGFVQVSDDDFILDFLLLQLNETSTQPIVQLNRQNTLPSSGQAVLAMGMGSTDPHDTEHSRASILQQVQLNAISNQVCEQSKGRNLTYEQRIFPSMMCTTGGPHNERDACSYDSGSPIIIPGTKPQEDLLVGLVSWGEECADPDFPGVNARVSEVSDWIDETVCAVSQNPPSDFCSKPSIEPQLGWKAMLLAWVFVACIIFLSRKWKQSANKVTVVEKETFGEPYNQSDAESDSYGSIEAAPLQRPLE